MRIAFFEACHFQVLHAIDLLLPHRGQCVGDEEGLFADFYDFYRTTRLFQYRLWRMNHLPHRLIVIISQDSIGRFS